MRSADRQAPKEPPILTASLSRVSARYEKAKSVAPTAAAALIVLVVLSVLAKTVEDVLSRDGWELSDLSHVELIAGHRTPLMVRTAIDASALGSAPALIVIALLVGVLLWRLGERPVVAAVPLLGLLLSGSLVTVAKWATDRPRPPVALHAASEAHASFPSGHSTNTATVLLIAVILVGTALNLRTTWRVVVGLLAMMAAGLVGISRIVLGVHYPTDVIAGLCLGILIALGVAVATLRLRRRLIARRLVAQFPQGSDGTRSVNDLHPLPGCRSETLSRPHRGFIPAAAPTWSERQRLRP